jgi:hypothetical protein
LHVVSRPGGTYLRFSNPASGALTISVYDAAGRLLARDGRFRAAGTQEFALPATVSGVGFATVTCGGRIATVKFAHVR